MLQTDRLLKAEIRRIRRELIHRCSYLMTKPKNWYLRSLSIADLVVLQDILERLQTMVKAVEQVNPTAQNTNDDEPAV